MARRRAYDALSAMAGALQRSAAEPRYVRIPVHEVAAVLDRGQRLMAHLSLVRLMLADRAPEWDSALAAQTLTEAHAVVAALLDHSAPLDPALGRADPGDLSLLPMDGAANDLMPWLQRRLQVLVHDARMMREADIAAMAKLE
ncbi:MAG: hypothetical protein H7242_07410 [Microbacteriaceae bacterium]|nr:hypothetical protein [Burkholderiaceae bacterium]